MHVRKAVITAAGRGVRLYPVAETVQKGMLPIVDRDGLAKPVIQIIAEEALDSGVEEVCVICAPGDESRYRAQLHLLRDNLIHAYEGVDWAREQAQRLDRVLRHLHFAVQDEPRGYGHAVYLAREFVDDEPFLLLLSDHLYVSHMASRRCAQQLIDVAVREECAVAVVQVTREHLVGHYGTLSGKRVPDAPGLYQIEKIIEKPSLSMAELHLQTPGLRAGFYLCLFGMHVLPPSVFDALEPEVASYKNGDPEIQLTPALQELAKRERYLAVEVAGARYDIGSRFGMLQTQLAISMAGKDRDEVLRVLVDVLAEAGMRRPAG